MKLHIFPTAFLFTLSLAANWEILTNEYVENLENVKVLSTNLVFFCKYGDSKEQS